MDVYRMSDKEIGKAILNVRSYVIFRAEYANPSLLDFKFDIDFAIDRAKLTEQEHLIIDVYYIKLGGDNIPGDVANRYERAAKMVGISERAFQYKLPMLWEKVGASYKKGFTQEEIT